ncbi:glycoside hydrolase family 88 protein [Segatella hominis]|uniref:glycoside hydrolase family 88 protein n=1 Tax=Segatella hominis TaxID=2518605 RepID=UPI001C43A2DA|nr:glycoside hydrolase family 88 protein [Segatella hominis]WOZ80295.1 glycoside hydrolase family 88 protein [Segatella hominis]
MRHLTRMSRNLSRWGGGFTYLYLSLMLLCFCAIGVKAADTNGSVKFNSGVRYSQWAINSRLHDFYGNQKKFGFDYYDNNGNKTTPVTWYKLDGTTEVGRSFDYVAGLVGKASLEAADFYENFDWSKPWFYAAQGYATGTPYATSSITLDNMNAAKMYFPILAGKLKSQEATTVANTAINAVIEHMKTYNTTYIIGSGKSALDNTNANDVQKTMFGGWFHKSTDYTDQMWCDGQYMGPALLAQIIKHTGKTNNISDNDWDIIAKQFSITWAQLYDKTTGLLYHGFTANPGDNASSSWAGIDKEKGIYHSASFWGRANAWYFLALVDILEVMPTDNTYYNTFKGYLTDLAAGIKKYQDETTGCWYQVMDKVPASLTGNYLEASCSSIFTAGYLKAIRLGLLDKATYEPIAKKAYEGLVNQFMVYDNKDNSTIQLVHSCTSAGLGGKDGRAGDDNYYLKGKDASVVTSSEPTSQYYYTEGKVLGGFIMAATEYERAYQNQDSKQILFAKDLAPSYDFTTTAGTLDATAYGDGTVSYQWYKDNAKIANATSATYTPRESGNYYCEATANGNTTIKTSETTVTAKSNSNTDNGSTDNNGGSDNGSASDGTVTFSADQLKNYSSPMTDASKIVTIATLAGSVKKESGGDIKVANSAAFTISVAEGKYIKSITYTIMNSGKGELTFDPTDAKRVTSSDKLTYTYNYSDNKLSTVTATNSANKGGIQVTSIKVVYGTISSVKKYTVSATAGTGGSVTIANAGTTVNSGSEVEENTSLTFTATPNEEYEFVNWTDASNKIVSANATYTTTVTAAISLTANFKAKTPTGDDVIYNWNTIGSQKENIAVTDGTKNINGTLVPCINFGSNYDVRRYTYMSIKDKYNGGFKVGDIITITGLYTGPKTTGIGMEIHTTRDGKAVFSTPYYDKELKTYTYTLTEDCDSLFFGRYGGATPNVTVLKVVRPAASAKQRLSANFDTNNIKVVTGTTSITLPNLTVKAGSTELTATSDYSVSYESDANEIATLNGTQVNFVSGKTGLVTITAKVTPKDATKYEGTEAYYQILIQDPTPLNISVTDIDMNTTDAEIKEPVVKVYGENDQLLKLGTDYTLSYSASNGGPVSFPDGKLTVAGSKYNWTVGVSSITVTATPTESMGKGYTAGSVDFTYTVTKGLITPKFLDVFSGANIKLAVKTGGKDNFNTFTVPLIYDGEDVSSYFDYTYEITSTSTANTQNVNGNMLTYYPKNAGTYTVKVSATVKKNEKDPTLDYTDVYAAPSSITFILDVKANYIRPVVKLNPVSVNMYTGTREDAPDVTITDYNTGKVIDESNYHVSWTTFTPGICKVDANGNIEAVSEGDGKIRVVVKGDKMESTTAFLKVLVDDPAMYRVRGTGDYGNQKRMWNQDKTLSVVLGGWLFPNPVATNGPESSPQQGPSAEGLSAASHWGTDKNLSSLPKWKLTGFDYYVVGDKNKNARQENGSNALPETTNIYSADFKSYTGTIKDNMFNVPCSGSFLEFNPATNGKVTVHIFQNGAFDSGVYRPQRRVFVMDEAGNFVESEAHIETTSGKPTGGIQPISSYKWDLNPKGKDTAPTIEEVRSHFNGIPNTFDMTANAFKNDVYESLLSNDLVPNAAAGKGNGSLGWSVLADSPVTYIFKVKAGKTYYLYNFGSKIGFYGFSFDEGETKPTVDPVNYNADDANANNVVEKTAEGHVAQVKIERKMVANRWTTCVLPFSLNRQQVDAIFGPAYSATAKEGTQILYFDHIEGNKAYFVRHAYNTIVAGKPFLIKPTKNIESINTADVTDYKYVTIENIEPNDWCKSNGYVWTSSYNTMNIAKNDYFIGASDGKFKAYSANSGTVKGFRGFLKANLPAGAKPVMLSISTSSITDGNDGETTGIEDLIITTDGELMPANSRVYNINGQLVSEDASSFQSLPSGIYIINGKKYIK